MSDSAVSALCPLSCPYGLYAEQLSGTSFTTPRKDNQKVWLYRIRPTVGHSPFLACDVESGGAALASNLVVNDFSSCHISPNQYRWRPFSMEHLTGPAAANRKVDFLQGLATLAGQGSPDAKSGMAIHIYTANASMDRKAFTNSDGDMLIVPQTGVLHIRTEMGMLRVAPGHIAVVQRGIAFSVAVTEVSRGYICEVYNGHFKLPELGPIGANGLAAPRDFLHPTAEFEDVEGEYQYVQKFVGKFFSYKRTHSPFDVVAWHGNYVRKQCTCTRHNEKRQPPLVRDFSPHLLLCPRFFSLLLRSPTCTTCPSSARLAPFVSTTSTPPSSRC